MTAPHPLERENRQLRTCLAEALTLLDQLAPIPAAPETPTRPARRVAVPYGPEDDLTPGSVVAETEHTVIVRLDTGPHISAPVNAVTPL